MENNQEDFRNKLRNEVERIREKKQQDIVNLEKAGFKVKHSESDIQNMLPGVSVLKTSEDLDILNKLPGVDIKIDKPSIIVDSKEKILPHLVEDTPVSKNVTQLEPSIEKIPVKEIKKEKKVKLDIEELIKREESVKPKTEIPAKKEEIKKDKKLIRRKRKIHPKFVIGLAGFLVVALFVNAIIFGPNIFGFVVISTDEEEIDYLKSTIYYTEFEKMVNNPELEKIKLCSKDDGDGVCDKVRQKIDGDDWGNGYYWYARFAGNDINLDKRYLEMFIRSYDNKVMYFFYKDYFLQ